jgi:chitinase
VELPKCIWRGHRNSGACKPGCNQGETEVGTLVKGCSTQHQSAYYTIQAPTMAYSQCKWFGEAPLYSKAGKSAVCPNDYPNFMVVTSFRAGGEQKCTQGTKSFCCKETPTRFTDCKWYRTETQYSRAKSTYRDFFKTWCETSCPAGGIRLATNPNESQCYKGREGFCCYGEQRSQLVPRNLPAHGLLEFQSLIALYMRNPQCPASFKVGDYYHNADATKKKRQGQTLLTLSNA